MGGALGLGAGRDLEGPASMLIAASFSSMSSVAISSNRLRLYVVKAREFKRVKNNSKFLKYATSALDVVYLPRYRQRNRCMPEPLRVWTDNPVALCIGLVLGLVSLVLSQSMSFWKGRLDVAGKVCRPTAKSLEYDSIV